MTLYKSKHFNKAKAAVLKYILFVFMVCAAGFTLLRFPDITGKAVTSAIFMCIKSVIPSLYPFMIVSSMLVGSLANAKIPSFLDKFTNLIFRQSGICLPIILLSQTGGFPVGATLINQLYKEKKITQNQSRRLLLFCINPGPAFVISYVGNFLLASKKAGVVIYLSVVASSLLLGFFTRFFADDSQAEFIGKNEIRTELSISDSFVKSVKRSTVSMAEICGWVIVFSCINAVADIQNISQDSKAFVSVLLEVTNACTVLCKRYPLPIIAGAIGWSGLCVHFQIMSTIINTKLKLKYFFIARIINSAFSVIICHIALKFIPIQIATAAISSATAAATASSVPVSFGLIFMCIFLLAGEKENISGRKTKLK